MDFNAVALGQGTPNACTPQVPDDFVGIRINAPGAVQSGADQFAICGTHRFPAEYVYGFDDIFWSVVLVVVDAATHHPYACHLYNPEITPDRGEPLAIQDPDWMANHHLQGYFNVELTEVLEDFPERDADYFIYALVETHVSNVVRVSYRA